MDDLDDLELDKAREPVAAQTSRSFGPIGIVIAITLVGVAVAVLLWLYLSKEARSSNVRIKSESVAAPKNERPKALEGEDLPLPPLADTDPLVRQLVSRLSSHPKVVAWFATGQLIRNFTVVVLNIAEGQTPTPHLRAVPLAGTFIVDARTGVPVIDPRSYRRYDEYADAVAALDAQGTARLYATLKPRIREAAGELGHPDDFDAVFERAIAELLQTPVIDGPVALTPKGLQYEFADPRLASLTAAQRQFLRMGPRNVRAIQAKLREIAPYLGIAPGL
jgi:DUF3014 family protein